jgi:hypothetical protein
MDDLVERVARVLLGGTYTDEQAAVEIAVAQYGAKARAIIPMVQAAEREQGCEVLFALARVWEGNALLHPGCIAAAEYMVEKAAAIRAIGAP